MNRKPPKPDLEPQLQELLPLPQHYDWESLVAVHPAARIFQRLPEEELKQLADSIRKDGLREPIKIYKPTDTDHVPIKPEQMLLLDGANRVSALQLLHGRPFDRIDPVTGFIEGVGEDMFENVTGSVRDPYAYVLDLNLRRRHLTKREQAAVIVAVEKARRDAENSKDPHDHPQNLGLKADRERVKKNLSGIIPKLKGKSRGHSATGKSKGRPQALHAAAVARGKQAGISHATMERAIATAEGKPPPKPAPKPRQLPPNMEPCPCCDGKGRVTVTVAMLHRQANEKFLDLVDFDVNANAKGVRA